MEDKASGARKMKHNLMATANAAAVTVGVLYTLCRLLVGLFPEASYAVAQSWFHGLQVTKMGEWSLTLQSFLVGLISSAVTAWVVGYDFGWTYNKLVK